MSTHLGHLVHIAGSPTVDDAVAALVDIADGALVVDRTWRTSDPDIFAVGDATATPDFLTGDPVVVPLAQTANRDGRLVADIIAGDEVTLPATYGTSVMGVSSGASGGLTLDGMVQRLVQKNVWEIDSKYK